VEAQVEELRQLGDSEPELTVRSEVSENFPQRAKFLLLRRIWSDAIEPWRGRVADWIARHIKFDDDDPDGYFADAGAALKRMKRAGISEQDIASVARMVAYETAFSVAYLMDYGCDEEAPKHMPGWGLFETDQNGDSTGRDMNGLHESILGADPSGLEGRVR
jgi:hypothetical protein